jgi:hypothetical protein
MAKMPKRRTVMNSETKVELGKVIFELELSMAKLHVYIKNIPNPVERTKLNDDHFYFLMNNVQNLRREMDGFKLTEL